MIEIKSLVELVLITLAIKLVVSQWTPPVQKSIQAIICMGLGSAMGIFLNPTKEGIVAGIIASAFAFYGGELTQAFKVVAKEVDEIDDIVLSKIKKD